MEVVVATVIAVIAVVALAYSFGMGRGLVNQYEVARMALAAAQRRMEMLAAAPTSADLALGPGNTTVTRGPLDVVVDGRTSCRESWTVERFADPVNPASADLKKVTVTVEWGQSRPNESITLTRLFSR